MLAVAADLGALKPHYKANAIFRKRHKPLWSRLVRSRNVIASR
jgi:hypothetical protein